MIDLIRLGVTSDPLAGLEGIEPISFRFGAGLVP